jgi:GNAT superfamily N-acetyltransferase
MHILDLDHHDRVRPLFRDLGYHLVVNAILEGSVPGAVYVDNPAQPQSAFAWTGRRFFLVGSPGNEAFNEAVRGLFTGVIYGQGIEAGLSMLELCYAPAHWEEAIRAILRARPPMKSLRQYYRFRELKHDWRRVLPVGFRLELINADLLVRTDLKNMDTLREELCSERPTAEQFLARSFGLCPIFGADEIAGWCTSEYNSLTRIFDAVGRCEVGIGTLEPYRRRGLATAMGSAFVEHALSRGISQIGWHCFASNIPSVATALKIGFEKVCDYDSYIAWFDETDNFSANGYECLRRGEFALASAWYERAFVLGRPHKWVYWGAACASAGLGQREVALRYLVQAVDAGFTDVEFIESSPGIASFRGTEEWEALMGRARERAGGFGGDTDVLARSTQG